MTGTIPSEEFVASMRYEAELYYKYKAYYGYMFISERRSKA